MEDMKRSITQYLACCDHYTGYHFLSERDLLTILNRTPLWQPPKLVNLYRLTQYTHALHTQTHTPPPHTDILSYTPTYTHSPTSPPSLHPHPLTDPHLPPTHLPIYLYSSTHFSLLCLFCLSGRIALWPSCGSSLSCCSKSSVLFLMLLVLQTWGHGEFKRISEIFVHYACQMQNS